MNDQLLKYLSDKLKTEMRVIEEELVMGKAHDFHVYQHTCGVYRGLLIASNIINETSDRMENDDE